MSNNLSSDTDGVLLSGERQRLMIAHLSATKFFRRELLRANTGWPLEHLKTGGAEAVLSTESTWKLGYAPDSYSRLVDHLRSRGFDFRTLIRAGLAEWTEDGQAVDQFRDQLMLLARDDRLDPVGFVGIGQGPEATFTTSPTTLIHRPSNALVGIAEQLDLLTDGAMVVVVNDPRDAMAIEKISRMSAERWAGIPMCGSLVSSAQAKTLYQYTATDTVIVALNGDQMWQRTALAALTDLSYFYRRVRAVELPDGHTAASLLQTEGGAQRLHDALLTTRPLADYKSRQLQTPAPAEHLGPESSGPSL
jgi:DNA primase